MVLFLLSYKDITCQGMHPYTAWRTPRWRWTWKLDQISLEAVYDEKERQSNVLKSVLTEFEKLKKKLRNLFEPEAEEI